MIVEPDNIRKKESKIPSVAFIIYTFKLEKKNNHILYSK